MRMNADMNNMEIWNRVQKTNPANTKHVNQRGGFTSICAHSQIMAATAEFGPVGTGWGYAVEHTVIDAGKFPLAVADVVLWYGDRSQCFGPWRGMSVLVDEKGRLDEDAPKKAQTDALTKGLSHLGFNADVFLGLFDDNRYVAQMRKEFTHTEHVPEPAAAMLPSAVADHISAIQSASDKETLSAAYKAAMAAGKAANDTDALEEFKSTMLEMGSKLGLAA